MTFKILMKSSSKPAETKIRDLHVASKLSYTMQPGESKHLLRLLRTCETYGLVDYFIASTCSKKISLAEFTDLIERLATMTVPQLMHLVQKKELHEWIEASHDVGEHHETTGLGFDYPFETLIKTLEASNEKNKDEKIELVHKAW